MANQEKMERMFAAIPWRRAIFADTGEKLDGGGVRSHIFLSKGKTDSLVIRSS
ncbi:MAG: hypothetical protein ACSHWZ_17525 [Sulfitobacter sp.]